MTLILVVLSKSGNETYANQRDSKLIFSETSEQLESSKAAGDPFPTKFFSPFQSVYVHQ